MSLLPPSDASPFDIALYDHAEIEARLRLLGDLDEFGTPMYAEPASADLIGRLRALLNDPRGPSRPALTASPSMLSEIDDLVTGAPNFAAAAHMIGRSARLSLLTGAPMVVRPMLLVGGPGVGKTRFAKRCAAALGVAFAEFSFAQADDIGQLLGHSVAWRGAQIGLATRTLLAAQNASPVIMIDEIEKAREGHNGVPLDALHTLLEPMSAKDFVDPFLEIKVRADGVIWIATANDISTVRPSMLDRFLIVPVDPPTKAQEAYVIRSIYSEVVDQLAHGFASDLTDDAVRLLRGQSPRAAKRIIELSLGFAAEDGRLAISATDIVRAQRLAIRPMRQDFGFRVPR